MAGAANLWKLVNNLCGQIKLQQSKNKRTNRRWRSNERGEGSACGRNRTKFMTASAAAKAAAPIPAPASTQYNNSKGKSGGKGMRDGRKTTFKDINYMLSYSWFSYAKTCSSAVFWWSRCCRDYEINFHMPQNFAGDGAANRSQQSNNNNSMSNSNNSRGNF